MKQLQDRSSTTVQRHRRSEAAAGATTPVPATRPVAQLPLWRVNLLRVGYLVMGGGLAVVKWPLLFNHEPWSLAEGTVQCLLVAMSVLALLGLRYPLRMLPILLFEVGWKALWLGIVALPLWSDGGLEGAFLTQTNAVLWVVIVAAVIPWRYAFAQFVLGTGDPWRRP
jgi:hypothetical protein